MKKLVSLLLAVMLAVTTLPALAETSLSDLFSGLTSGQTQQEPFPYTVGEYKATFDMLSINVISVTPTWATDGANATATMEGYGDVIVETNAEGYVTKLSTSMTVSANDASAANKLGMMIALVAMSSKTTEDISFLAANSEGYTTELVNGLYALLGDLVSAMNGPISNTTEVYGDTATYTLSIDMSDMANVLMTLTFTYEP
ncbi:MAG: hypothetical protein IKK57_03810 [Clostridia bacterium]|nr:hypothetical protein [Clostridia bacterium]